MDVRFYPLAPQPPSATDSSCVGLGSDSFHCNKLNSEKMYMGVPDLGQDFLPVGQFRVPELPSQSQQNMKQAGGPWKREAPTHLDSPRLPWSYSTPSLGDEDFNIPPITPPALPEHMLAMPHAELASFHPLCPPISQNGLPPFPQHPMDLSSIAVSSVLSQDGSRLSDSMSMMQQMANSESSRYSSHPKIEAMGPRIQSVTVQHGHMATFNQSQLGLSGASVTHSLPSPPGSKSATPSPSSSVHEDEPEDSTKASGGEKRPASTGSKKPKTPKKKKKKDPNEPQKPVSAYALFFRDTQAAIKGQNPSATFGEVSKIVASMWDGLGEEQKQTYKKKTETAKKEYLKQLAAYRASLVSQSYAEQVEVKLSPAAHLISPRPSPPSPYLGQAYLQQARLGSHFAPMAPTLAPHGVTASPPPQHQPIGMHSSFMPQGFPMQTEFQSAVNSTASTLTAQMDLAHGGCRNPMGPGLDWAGSYCSAGSEPLPTSLQREKPLYLH
ncbi:thymocyte selection-associated high mobility group box protein TOX-like isoform X1 [Paramormyrops kingsleyae]|uniref:thymocyte selection-associated high mobility group box protein TOX-like isoform X1 n=2 Tax=Paramormyrops kingsleyae TaxID=1676925 RepID=UPI003B971737